MTKNFCGLDFGTSNSTVGVWQGNNAILAPVEDHKITIPSAIFFDMEQGNTFFGCKAVFEYTDGAEGRLMRALKSVLGTSLMNDSTLIGRKSVSFQEILGFFVAHLKQKAENAAGQDIEHVILGRPVHFVDDDTDADRVAQDTLEAVARAQGFKYIGFQYEPVAAALDYEQTVSKEELALIIDIGGGTADFSVVRVSPERRRKPDRTDDVLSNLGIHIGGTDFDRLLSLKAAMPHLGYGTRMRDDFDSKDLDVPSTVFHDLATWQKINFLYTRKKINDVRQIRRTAYEQALLDRLLHILEWRKGHRLAIEVENTKIMLTTDKATSLNMDFIEHDLTPQVTRQDLHLAIVEQVDKLDKTVEATFKEAGVSGQDIHTVFLTGGSTSIPLVKDRLLALTPGAKVVEGDVYGSIGIGLTIDAKRKYG